MFHDQVFAGKRIRNVLLTTVGTSVLIALSGGAALAESFAFHNISTDPNDWQVDRTQPGAFVLLDTYQGRTSVLKMSADGTHMQSESFYAWEGYSQRTTMPAGNSFIGGDLWIQNGWQTSNQVNYIRTGMWGAAMPEATVAAGSYVNIQAVFPMVQFTNEGGVGHLEVWNAAAPTGFVDLPDTAGLINYNGWNTINMRLLTDQNKVEYYFNNQLVFTWEAPSGYDGSLPEQFWAMYLKNRNFSATSFDSYWSNLLSGMILPDGATLGDTPGDVLVTPGITTSVGDGATVGGSISADGTPEAPATVNFAGSATIGGSVIGTNSNIQFSRDPVSVTIIVGDLQLSGSTTSGGTVAAPITLNGTALIDGSSVLGGNWSIGGNLVSDGATLNPGNSIGVIGVAGNVTLSPDSNYAVEVDQAGNADLVRVGGIANLAGGVSVSAIDGYLINHPYTIVTAEGGFANTQFDPALLTWANTGNYVFLAPNLTYDAHNVFLTIGRNGVAFSSAARTPNQVAAANALDTLSFTSDLYGSIASMDTLPAASTFDQLSGEIYASAKTALIDNSRFVRDATGRQLRANYGSDAPSIWTQGYGTWGDVDGDGNAAGFDQDVGGLFIGADTAVFDDFRLGIVGGYGHSSIDLDERSGEVSVDTYSIGLYGGGQWNKLNLSVGLDHAWNDLSANRSVGFGGFSDSLSADYRSRTTQVYGDVGYSIDVGNAKLEPFAGLAYVNLNTSGFTEQGESAALTSAGDKVDTTFSTLGLRANTSFQLGGIALKANGTVGWRHSFDQVTPTATHAFAGSSAFIVAGAPLAQDVAIVELGLNAALGPNLAADVSYTGQFGSGTRDQGIRGNLAWKF